MKNEFQITGDKVKIFINFDSYTIIDLEDFTRVCELGNLYRARVQKYVKANVPRSRDKEYLHRFIVGAKSGEVVDHIDGNHLNNCKSNLRIVTHAQNAQNQFLKKSNKSGSRGISWAKDKKKWLARVQVNGKNLFQRLYDYNELDRAKREIKEARKRLMTHSTN